MVGVGQLGRRGAHERGLHPERGGVPRRALEHAGGQVDEVHLVGPARRAQPEDDVISKLVTGTVEGQGLSDEEAKAKGPQFLFDDLRQRVKAGKMSQADADRTLAAAERFSERRWSTS